ncbi:MAG: iron chelate uptake ABC transporter family permease subunit [Coriobacteriales bacterium]|jgi:iron complex transport system permease protein
MAIGSEETKGSAIATRGIGYERVDSLRAEERRNLRRRCLTCVVVTAVLAVLSLNIIAHLYSGTIIDAPFIGYIANPAVVVLSLQQALHNIIPVFPEVDAQNFASVLANSSISNLDFGNTTDTLNMYAWYEGERVTTIILTLLCGTLLALSGMLFQNVFKNPIATPAMLGAQSGMTLGVMLFVSIFGFSVGIYSFPRYALSYGCALVILAAAFAGAKFISGKRPFSVVDLLLVGAALGAIANTIVQYAPLGWDEGKWSEFFALSESVATDTSPVAWISVGVACLAGIVPIYLLRFQLNMLAFDDLEVRMLGVDPSRLRIICLLCGSLMTLVSIVTCGLVAMAALAVPFLTRYLFGTEAREQFWGNLCLGPLVLLVCRDVTDLLQMAFFQLQYGLTLGTVVSVLALPLVIVLARGEARGWS